MESLEMFIRFFKNSLLLCCVAMCENWTERAEDTQKRARSDQPKCLFSSSCTECIGQTGNKLDCRVEDGA